ncbi:MerR family transcriptional regulator [Kribbella lupini]|uniref:MerR family transcriptional regulator n=1 Tax=Kribbella lupini TaxID=291602 RepID=A0ABP4LGW5_9ACTN
MTSPQSSVAHDGSVAPVWSVGRVATMLGVPAVTIRSWEARYGIGPSQRTPGQHRRYNEAEVERLRRMHRLIAEGIAPQDAARLSLERVAARPGGVLDETGSLLEATEAFRVATLAELLDEALDRLGASRWWEEVVAPAFRCLDERFGDQGDCTDIELLLAQGTAEAIERYVDRRRLRLDGPDPVLLVCCPGERHTLPMAVLRAVLLERSQPVVPLGPETTDQAVLNAVDRVRPAAVVLWSSIRRHGQRELLDRLADRAHEVVAAGAGWPRSVAAVDSLRDAADALIRRRAARSPSR